jgi:amino acid adenylation domain-containing protein
VLYLLPQAVDRAADRAPDHAAARYGGVTLTYGELAERSNRLARVLVEHGVERGDRVGIYAGKGLDSTVAIHGIMKAAAAYVPLDPLAPPSRLALILKDCGIRHLITDARRAPQVLDLATEAGVPLQTVIGVDAGEWGSGPFTVVSWADVEATPPLAVETGLIGQDLAYVLYTSGSTGVPKGVMHTHRSALAWAEISAYTYGFTSVDRISNHAPLHFDLSTLDYFAAAVAGATTVIVPEPYARLPASFSKLIQDERMTVLYTVPLALTQLLLYGALDQRDLRSVRWVLFGGEPFPPKHLRALMAAMPGARFSNVYGPTEVNGVTYWIVPSLDPESDEPIPIGRPYGNVEGLVVDSGDEPVPVGEPGELLIRSPTMMRGYWGRPDLNERAFYRRPEFGHYEDVFYRTGDLVRWRSDGTLDFLGRKDRQIKTRGHRVELDEVEAALLSHPAVEAAGVFSVPDAEGSQRIHAAATLRAPDAASAEAVMSHAARILPRYALPEEVRILNELPRTSTGKIDRLALRTEAMMAQASSERP